MDISKILSIIAVAISLSITMVGLPSQIWKNYRKKETPGLSYVLFLLSFLSYTVWTFRAYFINDWYMFIAYIPGVIFSAVILFQIYLYKKP